MESRIYLVSNQTDKMFQGNPHYSFHPVGWLSLYIERTFWDSSTVHEWNEEVVFYLTFAASTVGKNRARVIEEKLSHRLEKLEEGMKGFMDFRDTIDPLVYEESEVLRYLG